MADDLSSPHGKSLAYDEIIVSRGKKVPFVPTIITPKIERPLRNGRYEAGEQKHLETLLKSDDRVLDLGAGLGLVSSVASGLVPEGAVLSVEAQPNLLPLIEETWRLNDVANAELRHGVIAPSSGPAVPFYVRGDFWASSFEPDSRPFTSKVDIPTLGLGDLIASFKPTIICCDVEGAEAGLFDDVDLSDVRALVIELHPKVYGEEIKTDILARLTAAGLAQQEQPKPSTVFVFERQTATISKPSTRQDPNWPPRRPRVLVATCMKDEGPFILEWLAWHKAIGVTDFVVYSNDCTDGTDALLDHLADRGEITHIVNPAVAAGSTYFQPEALNHIQQTEVFKTADFFISMDVDEFVNVHMGDGMLDDLFASVGKFDVLSMCELNHGSNGNHAYERGWLTKMFPGHDTPTPGRWRARAGVKSIVRMSARIAKVRNHRPDLAEDCMDGVWLDGSGKEMDDLIQDSSENGVDSRKRRDFVTLEHFPLRSLDSFLVKMHRGDVVIAGKQVSRRYWRVRNRSEHTHHDLAPGIEKAELIYRTYICDQKLMALHEACCAAHEKRIADLMQTPEYLAHREDILALE